MNIKYNHCVTADEGYIRGYTSELQVGDHICGSVYQEYCIHYKKKYEEPFTNHGLSTECKWSVKHNDECSTICSCPRAIAEANETQVLKKLDDL